VKICSLKRRLACALAIFLLSSIHFAHAATTVTGFTLGSFKVNETGAATYSIPIQVPPGTAGMEPKLSLNYNSQGGNGLLGMGWSLGGLSAITRCPKTMAQDGTRGGINYDSNDRYCLDGQRLISISGTYGADGTEYRTERDSFAKIVSNGTAGNGPSWFKVWTKSGQIMEFGNTTDSKVEAQGIGTVRVYALNKISDTKGNYLTVTYTEDNANGDYYPTRIDYTGNGGTSLTPGHSVRFTYQARADTVAGYVGGSIIKLTKLMIGIQTFIGESPIKYYGLSFGTGPSTTRVRLNWVKECNQDGSICFPPITIQWQGVGEVITHFQLML